MNWARAGVKAYNAVHSLLSALGRSPIALDEEALCNAAREATGLSDFGEDDFRIHLRVLLDAYRNEAKLSPFGRMMVQQQLVGILCGRLASEAAWKLDPGIRKLPVERPLFVLGLPRSGTTALHFAMAQDPAKQALEYWLGASPGKRPPRKQWDEDPRFKTAAAGIRFMYALDPSLKAIHWMTPDGPDECRHLLLQSFLDDTLDSNATIPSYTKWFAEQDIRPAYARHKNLLRLIGANEPDKGWILKYPAHLRNLDVLFETYPDACIIQTHRDPASVLPSLCSLVSGWRGLYEDRIDTRTIGRWQLEMWGSIMERGMQARDRLDATRFYDLAFEDVVRDPVAAIRGAYQHFGFEWSREAEQGMRDWLEAHPQGGHGGHRYRAEDYGLRSEAIRERFASYLDRFDVRKSD